MDRREALTATAALMGSAIIGSGLFLSGCTQSENKLEGFTDDVMSLLDEIGEAILPASDASPGAKAARIAEFMRVIVTDCYSPSEREKFFEGISTVQQVAMKKYGRTFLDLTANQKADLMISFDQEANASAKGNDKAGSLHFFTMLNQLTVWGFFSSEPGATKALRYVPIPGRYEGCIPYVKGDGAWVY